LGNIGSESEIGVVHLLLSQCLGAIYNFTDPAHRDSTLETLAAAAHDALHAAEPGSDHQLAWARSFIASGRSAAHAAVMKGLLAGSYDVPGLRVDIDLRWSLVKALASLGELDEPEILAEIERDPTSAGQRHAATARAARPTPEAKAAAWRLIMDDPELPNAILGATIAGFHQQHQEDLLRPYVDRYFERIADIWETRSSEMAQDIVVGMYPTPLIGQDTLDRTDANLRAAAPPAPLRRLLIEARDGIARAMRAREKDRAGSA